MPRTACLACVSCGCFLVSVQPTLCITDLHFTISLLLTEKSRSQTTHTLRKYILAGCVDKDDQWHKVCSALSPFFIHLLGGRVLRPLSHTHSVSLIHSDIVSSLETAFPYSWHIPAVSELFITGPARRYWITTCLIFKNNITYRTE